MKLIYFKWRGCNSSNSISIFLSFFKQFYLFLIAPPRSFWNVLILESVYDLFELRNVKNVYINSYEYHIKKILNEFFCWMAVNSKIYLTWTISLHLWEMRFGYWNGYLMSRREEWRMIQFIQWSPIHGPIWAIITTRLICKELCV